MVLRVAAGYLHRCRTNGTAVWPSILGEPLIFPMLVVLAVIWLLPHNTYHDRVKSAALARYNSLPSVHFDPHPSQTFHARYPANKTALYIEPREDTKFLVPLLLHMIMIVPPDWRFVFFGSSATVEQVRRSHTASMYEGLGKLHVRNLEEHWGQGWGRKGWEEKEKLSIDEMTNRLLTNKTFYEREMAATEWLLTFHSDAILCANSAVSVDEWLGWDWVGAPWDNQAKFGGSGGLSIRRVSRVRQVLEFQKRQDNSNPEDQWMSARLGLLPKANMCPPEKQREFAVEDVWYEWPLGFHMKHGGPSQNVWGTVDKRKKVMDYCPEIKIILDMYLDREKCPDQIQMEQDQAAAIKKEDDANSGANEAAVQAAKAVEEENKRLEEARRIHKEKEEARRIEDAKKQKEEQERIEAAKKKLEEAELLEKESKKLEEEKKVEAEKVKVKVDEDVDGKEMTTGKIADEKKIDILVEESLDELKATVESDDKGDADSKATTEQDSSAEQHSDDLHLDR